MIHTNEICLNFGGRKLFEDVTIKFSPGNCYGLIGANGSGKSTFIKILSGETEATSGSVHIPKGQRLSILKQDHFAYDEETVLNTVMMGNSTLYQIQIEKEELYNKPDFSDEDGIRASELEATFAELNGWEAESEAGIILAGLGVPTSHTELLMKEIPGPEKVKVLLAQALIGQPDVLLLDEPTNNLDIPAICWLENFLMDFPNTVIVVSHDRHFLNKVCTHIADIDYGKITAYAGNYDFWRMSSQLAQKLRTDQNKKKEEKAKDLKSFIQRFSANASKSKQATSRRKQLEKLELDELPSSSRKYPWVHFVPDREAGKEILKVEGLSKSLNGKKILDNIHFKLSNKDKVVFLSDNDLSPTTLFQILSGELEPDKGSFEFGVTTQHSYFPKDNSSHFDDCDYNLVDWLRQFSKNKDEDFIRGFLGRMLFSGDEALKKTNVLSGGERVRCMLSKMMLSGANVLMLDGPTNHLDLESITAVNDGVIRFKGIVLFTSHDHESIQTIANRIIEIKEGKIVNDLELDYDTYLEKTTQSV